MWNRPYRTARLVRFAAWTLICWVIVFWRLGYLPLLDPDEAHYAEITREMSAAHEWAVPLMEGKPVIDKPVLFHWLQGAAFSLLGQTELAARMPSAISCLLLLAITFWCGTRLFGRETGERATLMLATIPATFALSSIAIFDMLFTLCLFGALACFAIGAIEDRPRLQYLACVLVAGAVLTKGPVAAFLLGITAVLCLVHPDTRRLLLKIRWLEATAIVCTLAMPWFFWMWGRFQSDFVREYVLQNNLWLFGKHLYRRQNYPFFYGRVFLTAFLPWSPLVIARLVDLVHARRFRALLAGEVILYAWMTAVIGFFTLSKFKLDSYIFPAAPAVSLLAAHAWQKARQEDVDSSTVRITLLATCFALVVGGVTIWFFLFNIDLPIPHSAVLLPAALIAGGTTFAIQLIRARLRPSEWGGVLIMSLLCGYATIVTLGFPILERARPTREIARWLSTATTPDSVVGVYHLEKWKASLRFYGGRRIETLNNIDEARAFFANNPAGRCVMTQRDHKRLNDEGLALDVFYRRDAVVATEGRGIRRQRWGGVVVAGRSP